MKSSRTLEISSLRHFLRWIPYRLRSRNGHSSVRDDEVSSYWRLAAFVCTLLQAMPVIASSALADPLKLEPGNPVEIVCETQSVVVAGEAKVSKGVMRLKLEAAAEPGGMQAGTWSVVSVDATHASSFAAVHKEACAQGCPIQNGPKSQPMLWAPKIAMPDAMTGEAALTVTAIDPQTLTLKASTFRAKDLAALEQGECRRP